MRRRRLLLLRALAALLAAAVLFGVGVAVGEALHDNPKPGGRPTFTNTAKGLFGFAASTTVATAYGGTWTRCP